MIKKTLALTLFLLFLTAPALANGVDGGVGDEEPEPKTAKVVKYDKEGVPYNCLDWSTDVGCLYAVERYEDGFMLYFVDPEGMRFRVWLPHHMVAGHRYEPQTREPTHFVAGPCPSY